MRGLSVKISICLLFTGCLTANKADRQLSRIASTFPGKVATVCSEKYPIKASIDTFERTEYDFIEVLQDTLNTLKIDTLVNTVTKQKTIRLPQKTKTVTIVHSIENQATIHSFQDQVSHLSSQLNDQKDKADFYFKWFWVLIAVCIALFGLHLVRK
jgi:hypothetical protein